MSSEVVVNDEPLGYLRIVVEEVVVIRNLKLLWMIVITKNSEETQDSYFAKEEIRLHQI